MKSKILFFVSIIFLVLILQNVYSQSLDDVEDKVDDLEDKVDTYSEQDYWEDKWDYLGKEWKSKKSRVFFCSYYS